MKAHRERQDQARVKASDRWYERGLVFCNGHGGFLLPDKILVAFHKLLTEAGLPQMRFHDLRHSIETILLAAGVYPKVVQERLVHSTISMTMDIYSHVLPSMQQDVARQLDEIF